MKTNKNNANCNQKQKYRLEHHTGTLGVIRVDIEIRINLRGFRSNEWKRGDFLANHNSVDVLNLMRLINMLFQRSFQKTICKPPRVMGYQKNKRPKLTY